MLRNIAESKELVYACVPLMYFHSTDSDYVIIRYNIQTKEDTFTKIKKEIEYLRVDVKCQNNHVRPGFPFFMWCVYSLVWRFTIGRQSWGGDGLSQRPHLPGQLLWEVPGGGRF